MAAIKAAKTGNAPAAPAAAPAAAQHGGKSLQERQVEALELIAQRLLPIAAAARHYVVSL